MNRSRNENLGIIIAKLVEHKMLRETGRHDDAVSEILSDANGYPPEMLDKLKSKSCGSASMLLAVLCGISDEYLEGFARYMSDPRYAAEIDVADARDEAAVDLPF